MKTENYDELEKLRESIKDYDLRFEQLTPLQIEYLKAIAKYDHGLMPSVVDELDRLQLIKCLFSHCENRDMWRNAASNNTSRECLDLLWDLYQIMGTALHNGHHDLIERTKEILQKNGRL